MARKSDLLRNVDFTKSNWNIHVRVMRMWEPLYGKQKFASTLELAVSDRELMMKTVKKKIQENGIYFIKDFFVTRNVVRANQTKVSTHKYKISFQQNTSIDDATDDDFPPISFHTRAFQDIISRNQINEIDLIDAIGLLVSKREIEEITIEGKTHRTLSIILQDLEKNVIECTLWDNYIDYLFNNATSKLWVVSSFYCSSARLELFEAMQCIPTKANERYVLEVNAKDFTAPVTLLLWDRECFQVYGKTANEMRGAKDGNIELFPADLELIEGRSFLFKVHVKPSTKIEGETVFHVIKLTEDKDLISKFGGQTNNRLHSDALISVEDETPHSKESIGETINIKDCTPAKRLFSSSTSVGDGDGDVDIASATKISRVTIKIEK
ncbi:hypothetical protein ACFE04_026109 [Oxalis oulophora]